MRTYAAIVVALVSVPAVAGETTDAVTAYARDDCIERTATLTRFTDNASAVIATFSYQEVNTCVGELLRAGSGSVPPSVVTGGWRGGVMSINVNVGAVPGYTYAGAAYSGRIRWTATDERYVRGDSGEMAYENTVLVNQWRKVRITQSAVVSGVNNLIGPGPGAFHFTLITPK